MRANMRLAVLAMLASTASAWSLPFASRPRKAAPTAGLASAAGIAPLAPFSHIDVGYSTCFPLSVVVKNGTDYGFDVVGPAVCGPAATCRGVFAVPQDNPLERLRPVPQASAISVTVTPNGFAVLRVRPLCAAQIVGTYLMQVEFCVEGWTRGLGPLNCSIFR